MILRKAQPTPIIGTVEEKIKYAWLPTTMTDGTKIWFEYYSEKREYKTINRYIRLIRDFLPVDDWTRPVKTHLPWHR